MADKVEKNGVAFYKAGTFEKQNINHGFSTRIGGVSEGWFSTMNLSFSSGDDRENVLENYRRFAGAVGFPLEQSVLTHQVHETSIHKVTKEDWGKGITKDTDIKNTDGLITNVKGTTLMIFYADCVPILFADKKKGVIGAVHSGWRGTVGKIGQKLVRIMCDEYGCQADDIYAVIGPSICKSCYEVSGDVIENVKEVFPPESYHQIFKENEKGKYQLDLWAANQYLLEEVGISHIEVMEICTCCHADELFSHRATGGKRGVMAGVITL